MGVKRRVDVHKKLTVFLRVVLFDSLQGTLFVACSDF